MSLCVSVRPLSRTLYLHGTPDAATFYSLSGTVELSLDSSAATSASLLLTSLVVKFVGRSQHTQHDKDALFSPLHGKDRLTLCSVTRELVDEPTMLDFTNTSYSGDAARYSVLFDLHSIPGWLPPSAVAKHAIANDDELSDILACSETTYSLTVHATYKVIEAAHSDGLLQADNATDSEGLACLLNACNPLSSLSTALSSSSRSYGPGPAYNAVNTQDMDIVASLPTCAATDVVPITVTRLLVPSSLLSSPGPRQIHQPPPPTTKYTITAHSTPSSPIPDELCSRLQLVVSTPSFLSTSEDSLGFVVKMRLKPQEGESADAGTLTVSHVDIDIEEHAAFRTRPEEVFVTCSRESGGARMTSEPVVLESTSTDSPRQNNSRWWSSALRALSSSFSSRLVAASDFAPPYSQPSEHRRSTSISSHTVEEAKWRVARSLLHEDAASSFWLDENETPDSSDDDDEVPVKHAHALGQDGSWSTIRLNLKLINSNSTTSKSEGGISVDYSSGSSPQRTIAPSYHGPYARVAHLLRISAHVGYRRADGTIDERMKDTVQFELPLHFVVRPPSTPSSETTRQSTLTTSSSTIRTNVNPYASYAMRMPSVGTSGVPTNELDPLVLPAYSQIFDRDGELRVDTTRGVPPPYCPAPSSPRTGGPDISDQSSETDSSADNGNAQDGVTLLEDGVLVTKPELVPIGTAVLSWQHLKSLIETR